MPTPEAMKRAKHQGFGGCPECGEEYGDRDDVCINVGPVHWFVCDKHMVKWCIGSNLFGVWWEQTPAENLENEAKLALYRSVEAW